VRAKSGLFLYEKTRHIKISEFKEIVALSPHLYKTYFKNTKGAKACVNNENLKRMNIVAFIPRNFVELWGIIKGVPAGFSDQEILKNNLFAG